MCGLSEKFLSRILLLNIACFVTCAEITDTVFNTNIREYAVKEDGTENNASNVRTLQKEEVGRYASFAPIHNPIRFKDIPDNALSSSSYSRGLLHHEHTGHEGGYGLHDGIYDDHDGSHYGHGYEYVHGDDHHDFGHYNSEHHGHGHFGHHHHLGHGHHHKHHKHHDYHHLASKALLWPIAGIALLGAAAALVTNPVLLQLGVVSGRRRRRDTVEVSGPDFVSDEDLPLDPYGVRNKDFKKAKRPKTNSGAKELKRGHKKVSHDLKDNTEMSRFVPIPLKRK